MTLILVGVLGNRPPEVSLVAIGFGAAMVVAGVLLPRLHGPLEVGPSGVKGALQEIPDALVLATATAKEVAEETISPDEPDKERKVNEVVGRTFTDLVSRISVTSPQFDHSWGLEAALEGIRASSDLQQVAARLRQTRADQEKHDFDEGFQLGVRWAKEIATESELKWARDTHREFWVALTLDPEAEPENSLRELLETEYNMASRDGTVRLERTPFTTGIFASAAKVYEQVAPLL